MNDTFYIAHPIDRAGDWQFGPTKAKVREALAHHGVWAYWPRQAWDGNRAPNGEIRTAIGLVNRTAADACQAMIAVLPDQVASLGVPAEIERALGRGKAVGLVAGKEQAETVQVQDWAARGALVLAGSWGIDDLVRDLRMKPSDGATGQLKFAAVDTSLEKGLQLPTRAYAGDAGFDLYVSEDRKLLIGEVKDVPTNVACQLPEGMWALMVGRSSTAKRGLLLTPSIIDGGYRGELFASIQNVSGESQLVRKGERLAQLIPMPLLAAGLEPAFVDTLGPSDRGGAGWGSSGR